MRSRAYDGKWSILYQQNTECTSNGRARHAPEGVPLTAGSRLWQTGSEPRTVSRVKLTDEDIRDLIEVWRQEFGETLTVEQARHHGSQIMQLCLLLARPLRSERAAQEPRSCRKMT